MSSPDWNLDIDSRVVWVRKNVWRDGSFQTTKSKKNRSFLISLPLAERLADRRKRATVRLVWHTSKGRPFDQGNIRRELYAILDRLGLPRAGMHAFRHGNETVMDRMNTPPKLRQKRLGHTDERMMMHYSHVASEDEIALADKLGAMFAPVLDSVVDSTPPN